MFCYLETLVLDNLFRWAHFPNLLQLLCGTRGDFGDLHFGRRQGCSHDGLDWAGHYLRLSLDLSLFEVLRLRVPE